VKRSRGEAERPSPPPPLEANDQLVAGVGTAAWAVALAVLLIVRNGLPGHERWWIWTCLTGVALGLFALWYVPRLKRSRARAALRASDQSAPRDSGSNTVSSTETPGKSTRS
jgi:Protein of unknown function (DUF2530)